MVETANNRKKDCVLPCITSSSLWEAAGQLGTIFLKPPYIQVKLYD